MAFVINKNIPVVPDAVGFIVGHKGHTVSLIKQRTGAWVQLHQPQPQCGRPLPWFHVRGFPHQVDAAEQWIETIKAEAASRGPAKGFVPPVAQQAITHPFGWQQTSSASHSFEPTGSFGYSTHAEQPFVQSSHARPALQPPIFSAGTGVGHPQLMRAEDVVTSDAFGGTYCGDSHSYQGEPKSPSMLASDSEWPRTPPAPTKEPKRNGSLFEDCFGVSDQVDADEVQAKNREFIRQLEEASQRVGTHLEIPSDGMDLADLSRIDGAYAEGGIFYNELDDDLSPETGHLTEDQLEAGDEWINEMDNHCDFNHE